MNDSIYLAYYYSGSKDDQKYLLAVCGTQKKAELILLKHKHQLGRQKRTEFPQDARWWTEERSVIHEEDYEL